MCWNPGKILLEANGHFKRKAAAIAVLKEPGGGLGVPGSSHGKEGGWGWVMGKRRSWVEARAAHTQPPPCSKVPAQGYAKLGICQAVLKACLHARSVQGFTDSLLALLALSPAADGKTKAQVCQCREPRSAPGCRLQSHHS